MGTRSATHFIGRDGKAFMTLYRQYDGYPEGHGQAIFDALGGRKIVNGFGTDRTGVVNGIESAAVILIATLAPRDENGIVETGEFYVVPPGDGEEYNYELRADGGSLHLRIDNGKILFDGLLADFPEWLEHGV